MLLDDFKLEIKVNNKELHEYNLFDSSLDLSNALKSHVYMEREKRKKFCEYATFIAIPEPGTCYDIELVAYNATENNPVKAKVYVDGKNDGEYYRLPSSLKRKVSYFYNKNSTKKHKFIFDSTEWVEENVYNVNFKKAKYGGLGAISVCFYKAKFEKRGDLEMQRKLERRIRKSKRANVNIERTKVPEVKKCVDIAYTTKFDEGEAVSLRFPNKRKLVTLDMEPMAVLHINYRPADWFITNGIPVHQTLRDASSPSELFEYNKPIQLESDDSPTKVELDDVPVKLDDKEQTGRVSQNPIIIISDDDE